MTDTANATHSMIGEPPVPKTSVVIAYEAGSLLAAALLLWLLALGQHRGGVLGLLALVAFFLITIVVMAAFMLPFSRLPASFGNVWTRTIVWGGVTYFVVGLIYLGFRGFLPHDIGELLFWPTWALADVSCLFGACIEFGR